MIEFCIQTQWCHDWCNLNSLPSCFQHDPEKLTKEIQQWLTACQEALQELLDSVNAKGHNAGMDQLLLELGIPRELVQYNSDSQEFETKTT